MLSEARLGNMVKKHAWTDGWSGTTLPRKATTKFDKYVEGDACAKLPRPRVRCGVMILS